MVEVIHSHFSLLPILLFQNTWNANINIYNLYYIKRICHKQKIHSKYPKSRKICLLLDSMFIQFVHGHFIIPPLTLVLSNAKFKKFSTPLTKVWLDLGARYIQDLSMTYSEKQQKINYKKRNGISIRCFSNFLSGMSMSN